MQILGFSGMKYTKLSQWCLALRCLRDSLVVLPGRWPSRLLFAGLRLFQRSSPRPPPAVDDQPDAILTIHKRVDEVNVLFIATDQHGKFVRDLNQGDFTILDDHKPPQSIVNFRRETDLPLAFGLAGRCQRIGAQPL